MNTNDFRFPLLPTPAVMGILNITPNSFSDGGLYAEAEEASRHAEALQREGAALLDLGAEASSFFRIGVEPVPAEEQLRRLLPVVESLRQKMPRMPLSIDTRSATVARECLRRSACVINDISAGAYDPEIFEVVAEAGGGGEGGASMILMHMGSTFPATPTADDPDIVQRVADNLAERIAAAEKAGIDRSRLALDPGVGFGKTMADNWRLALNPTTLKSLGLPIVLGASRKRFLETPPPAEYRERWLHEVQFVTRTVQAVEAAFDRGTANADKVIDDFGHPRDIPSAAITRIAAANGIGFHRVHHVTFARLALTLAPRPLVRS